jgi:hypothetical protein
MPEGTCKLKDGEDMSYVNLCASQIFFIGMERPKADISDGNLNVDLKNKNKTQNIISIVNSCGLEAKGNGFT